MDKLTPSSLGALIALYEHKVFAQSVIWDINAFDQWGVELGKKIGNEIYQSLCGPEQPSNYDGSTKQLIKRFKNANQR
jgi:glucose-6-phosphate isomerase